MILASALRITWSTWQLRALVVGCAVAGALAVPDASSGWPSTVATLAEQASLPVLAAAPLVAALVFGRETDRGLPAQAYAVARPPESWQRALGVAAASAAALAGAGFVVVGAAWATTPWAQPRAVPGHDPVLRTAALAVLSWLLLSVWTSALAVHHPSGVGGLLGTGFAASYLIGTFTDNQGMGVVLRVAHPALALRAIAAGPESYPKIAGLLAAVSVAGWTWAGLHRLGRRRVDSRSGGFLDVRAWSRGGADRVKAPRRAARRYQATGIASLVCGVVLPTLLSHDLPPQARPALIADRLTGNAPEQRVERFLQASWIGNWQGASALTATGDARALLLAGGSVVEPLRSRPPQVSFWLMAVPTGDRATVGIDDGRHSVTACLSRDKGQWLIVEWSRQGICP